MWRPFKHIKKKNQKIQSFSNQRIICTEIFYSKYHVTKQKKRQKKKLQINEVPENYNLLGFLIITGSIEVQKQLPEIQIDEYNKRENLGWIQAKKSLKSI